MKASSEREISWSLLESDVAMSGCSSKADNVSAASDDRRSLGVISGACSRPTYKAPRKSFVANAGGSASHSWTKLPCQGWASS